MSEWTKAPLGNVADIWSGGTPSRTNPKYWNGDVPWVTPSDITACKTNHLFDTQDSITTTGLAACSATLLPAGALLLTSRATIGEVRIAARPVATNQGFKSLVPKGINGRFLFYQCLLRTQQFKSFAAGSTFLEINRKDTARIAIPYPVSSDVQAKIGRILETLDQAIEKTEALIEKYQQIKAGLMHDLFTRGIGPDGKLRPPREQAPELYQETPIGWIPKEWLLEPCANICTRISVGIVIQPSLYYVAEGVPAFRSANIRERGIDASNFVYITPASNALLAKSQVRTGDILSVRTGYPGTSAVVPSEFAGANCIDVLISTPGERVLADFLCVWINSPFGKEQVLRQQGGMAQQRFNVGEMKELLTALPRLAEQEETCRKLRSCTEKLDREESRKEKLLKQKAGLMHELLTDKVLVNPDAPEPANA